MNRSFFLVANAAASLLLPYILESLINRAEDEAESASQHTRAVNKSIITQGLLQLVALALLESICQFLYTLLFRIAGAKLVQRVVENVADGTKLLFKGTIKSDDALLLLLLLLLLRGFFGTRGTIPLADRWKDAFAVAAGGNAMRAAAALPPVRVDAERGIRGFAGIRATLPLLINPLGNRSAIG
jgi:hypothetical protein